MRSRRKRPARHFRLLPAFLQAGGPVGTGGIPEEIRSIFISWLPAQRSPDGQPIFHGRPGGICRTLSVLVDFGVGFEPGGWMLDAIRIERVLYSS